MAVTYYYISGTYQSAWDTTNTTTAFDDGSADDTSTSVASPVTSIATLTAFLDYSVAGTISANRFTYTVNLSGLHGEWILEGTNNTGGAWTTLDSGSINAVAGAAATITSSSLSGSYRYYRLSISESNSGPARFVLSDWRPTIVATPTSKAVDCMMAGRR